MSAGIECVQTRRYLNCQIVCLIIYQSHCSTQPVGTFAQLGGLRFGDHAYGSVRPWALRRLGSSVPCDFSFFPGILGIFSRILGLFPRILSLFVCIRCLE
jgi:hypothetical protein